MKLKLTPSQENYLEHIWHLSSNGVVRAVNLAESVGVKRPSVTRAINTLANFGLVQHEHYGDIELTPKGYRAAQYIVYRDRCLNQFMTQVLQLDSAAADEEVCRMEHAVSEKVMQRLDVLSNFISSHGTLQKEISRLFKEKSLAGPSPKAVGISVKPHI
ncbi:MAG: metal-dependent transcriptional regulator [Desulfosarcinaceae bacterium]|jgi:Mn-dependent DtxR family transcriptional regulator